MIRNTFSAFRINIRRCLPLLATLILWACLPSCNDEDDIQEVFTGKTWKLTYTGQVNDWTNLGDGTVANDFHEEKREPQSYTLYFTEGGVRITAAIGTVWRGKWEADGESNHFAIYDLKKEGEGSTANEKLFLQRVSEAQYYRGSAVILRLFSANKKDFVQFSAQP